MSRLIGLFVEVPASRDPTPVFSRFATLLARRVIERARRRP